MSDGRGLPLAHPVDGEDRGVLEGRWIVGRGAVAQVVPGKVDWCTCVELSPDVTGDQQFSAKERVGELSPAFPTPWRDRQERREVSIEA